MAIKEEVVGNVYGHITVLADAERKGRNSRFVLCVCKCGTKKEFRMQLLKTGKTKSCGCVSHEMGAEKRRTHGGTGTRLHNIWRSIKRRCYNPNERVYEYYGGKGVVMHDDWLFDFARFRDWSEKNGYSEDLTIDRIDNTGNYEPSNCRWVSMQVQSNNKSNNRMMKINGTTKTVADWSRFTGVNVKTIYNRLYSGYPEHASILSVEEFKEYNRGRKNEKSIR